MAQDPPLARRPRPQGWTDGVGGKSRSWSYRMNIAGSWSRPTVGCVS